MSEQVDGKRFWQLVDSAEAAGWADDDRSRLHRQPFSVANAVQEVLAELGIDDFPKVRRNPHIAPLGKFSFEDVIYRWLHDLLCRERITGQELDDAVDDLYAQLVKAGEVTR